MKYLYKLKKAEYDEGAKLSLANAMDHFNAAIKLSESELYGFACSHLVLTLEELAKASVLKIRAIDNSIEIEDLRSYFHSHKTKHKSISSLFIHSLKYSGNYQIDPQSLSVTDVILLVLILIFCLIDKNKDFDSDLENVRLLGTYVELNDDRTWSFPKENFKVEKFEENRISVKNILAVINETLFDGKIHKENIKAFVKDLKKTD